MKPMRAEALDALRGFAIFMMILSGSIVTGVLPNWMSHCQVPPGVGFDPSIYGITWVDLVFPFFLFAMGAAMPFSVGSRLERGENKGKLILEAVWRFVLLAFFAIYLQHIYPWSISPVSQDASTWALTLCGFVTLFAIYLRIPGKLGSVWRFIIHAIGIAAAIAIMLWVDCRTAEGGFDIKLFDPYKSNIIILVLSNMALFGTVIYILTLNNPIARLAVLPFFMAIILCKEAAGSWEKAVFDWSPLPWLYRFDFLKYLFIVIPGTLAGEMLRAWVRDRSSSVSRNPVRSNYATALVLLLSVAIIAVNVWLLYERALVINLFASAALATLVAILARRMSTESDIVSRLSAMGAYLLMLGLFFEAFAGGIRKDPSSFEYWFTTSGLACYCLIAFIIMCDIYHWRTATAPFTMSGKNPMIAYVAAYVFVMPVLNLCHIGDVFTLDYFTTSPFMGLLHGLIVTALAVATAMAFTRIKWFWRT